MLKGEKLDEISRKLSSNRDDHILAFRNNLFMYIDDKEITIKDISESADVPFSTLNSFLYGNSKDIKLSTVVKLAKALNVSIDELVGAETISDISKESLAICRNLPDNALYLVRWYIRYLDKLNADNEPNKRYIPVMELEHTNNNLKITTIYHKLDITYLSNDVKHKIFFGITMPCDNYMPYYTPYNTLLIANDRNPTFNDHILIRFGKCLEIGKIDYKDNLYSIRDGKFRCTKTDADEIIGYIIAII